MEGDFHLRMHSLEQLSQEVRKRMLTPSEGTQLRDKIIKKRTEINKRDHG